MVNHEGYKGILVCGDLNYPDINQIEGCGGISVKEDDNLFLECLDDLFLIQNVSSPTFINGKQELEKLLYFVLTSEHDSILQIDYSALIVNVTQGHLVIDFKFTVAQHIKEKISGEK